MAKKKKPAWNFERTKRGYTNLWKKAKVKPGLDATYAQKFASKIIAGEKKYREVQAITGVPWYFIGALDMRESGCNGGVLHNGEMIVGKNRKTKLVPKGRGPFKTWQEAAVDALRLKNLHKVPSWDVARIGFHAELYNGLGYTSPSRGVNSPYLWAGSTLEQKGKFIRDGVFSKTADDKQIGVMTVLKRLSVMRPDIAAELNGEKPLPQPDVVLPEPPKKPEPKVEPKPAIWSGIIQKAAIGATTILAALAENFTTWASDYRTMALVVVLVLLLWIIWERSGKPDIAGIV
jgi:lysozyme family protein